MVAVFYVFFGDLRIEMIHLLLLLRIPDILQCDIYKQIGYILRKHRDWFIKNCKGILPYCVCTNTIRIILLIFPKSMDLDLSKMVQHIFLAQFLQKLRAKMFQTNFFKNSQNWSKLLTFMKKWMFWRFSPENFLIIVQFYIMLTCWSNG